MLTKEKINIATCEKSSLQELKVSEALLKASNSSPSWFDSSILYYRIQNIRKYNSGNI